MSSARRVVLYLATSAILHGLTLAQVRNAGHVGPHDAPPATFYALIGGMIQTWQMAKEEEEGWSDSSSNTCIKHTWQEWLRKKGY